MTRTTGTAWRRAMVWLHWHTLETAIVTLVGATGVTFMMPFVLGGM